MKVLLIGANGNLGLRLVAALLTHHHTVVAFVRSPEKLKAALPISVFDQISTFQGSAMDSVEVKKAIMDFNCDAVINTAGVAALPPWGKSELPEIFRAVLRATQEVGAERQNPLRAWFLAGTGVLNYPGTDSMLSNYVPIYLEHRQNLQLLKSLPPKTIDWSMLCPNTMVPESNEFIVPTQSALPKLIANATTPPLWKDNWVKHVPLIGKPLLAAVNAPRYQTTLEQNADFIANDLESSNSEWIGMAVGVVDESMQVP